MEIPLGNAQHTIYSDEPWFLVVETDGVALEARFQSDAPRRTGWPDWVRTEFCVSRDEESAVGRICYDDAAHLLAAPRPSFVTEAIWAKALEACRGLAGGPAV
jgi:hypothetical protein